MKERNVHARKNFRVALLIKEINSVERVADVASRVDQFTYSVHSKRHRGVPFSSLKLAVVESNSEYSTILYLPFFLQMTPTFSSG